MSNKLKHLDVLYFPTLFPSGKFGESHDRSVPISLSEFGKSHLLNKDSRFRKDPGKRSYVNLQLVCTTC